MLNFDGGSPPGATFADGPVPQAQPVAELAVDQASQLAAVDTQVDSLEHKPVDSSAPPEISVTPQQLSDLLDTLAKAYADGQQTSVDRLEYKKQLKLLRDKVGQMLQSRGVRVEQIGPTINLEGETGELIGVYNDIQGAVAGVEIDREANQDRMQRGLSEQETKNLIDFIRNRLNIVRGIIDRLDSLSKPGHTGQREQAIQSLRMVCTRTSETTRAQVNVLTEDFGLATQQVLSGGSLDDGDLSAITTYVNRNPQIRLKSFHELLSSGSGLEEALMTAYQQASGYSDLQASMLSLMDQFKSPERDFRAFLRSWTTT